MNSLFKSILTEDQHPYIAKWKDKVNTIHKSKYQKTTRALDVFKDGLLIVKVADFKKCIQQLQDSGWWWGNFFEGIQGGDLKEEPMQVYYRILDNPKNKLTLEHPDSQHNRLYIRLGEVDGTKYIQGWGLLVDIDDSIYNPFKRKDMIFEYEKLHVDTTMPDIFKLDNGMMVYIGTFKSYGEKDWLTANRLCNNIYINQLGLGDWFMPSSYTMDYILDNYGDKIIPEVKYLWADSEGENVNEAVCYVRPSGSRTWSKISVDKTDDETYFIAVRNP